MKLSAAVKEKGVGDTNRNERELQEKEQNGVPRYKSVVCLGNE